MRDRNIEYQKPILVGVAVAERTSKRSNAPRQWHCFIQATRGDNPDLPFIAKIVFTLSNKKRIVINAPGPYIIDGEGTDDFSIRVRLISVDYCNMPTHAFDVQVRLHEPAEKTCGLWNAITHQKQQCHDAPTGKNMRTRRCTVDGKPYRLDFFIDTLIFQHIYRKVRQALCVPTELTHFPCVLGEKFSFFEDEEPGSEMFFHGQESKQLEFLDSLIAQVDGEIEKTE